MIDNNENTPLLLTLGRLEGKVDTILSTQQRQDQRIGNLETTHGALAVRVASLEGAAQARGKTSSTWLSSILAALAVAVSTIALFFHGGGR